MGQEHALAGPRRPAGDVWRDNRATGRVGPAAAFSPSSSRCSGPTWARRASCFRSRAFSSRESSSRSSIGSFPWRKRPMRSGGWRLPNTLERSSSRSDAVSGCQCQPLRPDRARQRRAGDGDHLAVPDQSGHRGDGRQRGRDLASGARARAGAVRSAQRPAQIPCRFRGHGDCGVAVGLVGLPGSSSTRRAEEAYRTFIAR